MLLFYSGLMRAYGWTPAQVDDTDLLLLLDLDIVEAKVSEARERRMAYVEDVL